MPDLKGERPKARSEPWPWFGPMMLAFGIVFLVVTLVGWSSSRALEQRGLPTTATVVRKYTSPTETGYGFRVTCRFMTPDGRSWTGDHPVSQARYEALRMGDAVAVVYLADEPAVNALAPYELLPPIVLIGILAFEAMTVVIGTVSTWRTLSAWTERRA